MQHNMTSKLQFACNKRAHIILDIMIHMPVIAIPYITEMREAAE